MDWADRTCACGIRGRFILGILVEAPKELLHSRLGSFKYDPFGRRIYKSSSAGTSIYAFDFDDLIEETNASGTAVARYSQGQNLDEPLAMLRSGTTSYYQADGVGSVTSLSSGAGALAETYAFDSFGKQTSSSGSLTNPFQYTGREFDSETNLYFYRARYYDPTTGRFSKEDPVRYIGGINFYRFVGNNPVIFTDPLKPGETWGQTGRFPVFPIGAFIAQMAGGRPLTRRDDFDFAFFRGGLPLAVLSIAKGGLLTLLRPLFHTVPLSHQTTKFPLTHSNLSTSASLIRFRPSPFSNAHSPPPIRSPKVFPPQFSASEPRILRL
ncbi:MAG: RHS repeat domain-containing protein, partial [Candidatus Acidiferrales bacterium]